MAEAAKTRLPGDRFPRASWSAIFVGAIIAVGLMIFFTTLGVAIGAASINPDSESNPLGGLGSGSAIYLIVTQLVSLAAGGYAAGKLSGVPRSMAAILHGAAIWAAATILMAWAAISGTSATISAGTTVLSSAARQAVDAAQYVAPDDLSFPDLSGIAQRVSFEDLPPEIRDTLQERNVTPRQFATAVENAFRNVVSESEQERAVNIVQRAVADALASPGDISEDVNRALDRLVEGPDAVFSEEDREEVRAVLRNRLGVTEQDVEEVIATVENRFDAAVEQARETADELQQRAVEAAGNAADAVSSAAFWLSLASILGLAAAAGGALAGRPKTTSVEDMRTTYS